MRQLSPITQLNYKMEKRIFYQLKAENKIEEYLAGLKLSTRAMKITVWNRYCNAGLELPYEQIKFDPKCIPSADLQRFKNYVAENCNEDQKLFIELGLRLGLRLSEILQMNAKAIREDGIAVLRKGGKTQTLPCPQDLIERIRISNGLKFKERYYQRLIRKIGATLGFKISPHSLRHTFATEAIRDNANIVIVKQALGHSSLDTTMKYISISPEQLRSIIK